MSRLLIAAVAAISVNAMAAEPTFLTAEQKSQDFASFCRFIDEEYAYFDLKATDWQHACKFYANHLEGAVDRSAYVELLEQALAELYDSHAHLGTSTRRSYRLVPTHADLFAAWVDGRAIISDVRSGSAAEAAGLRPGMEVVAINGVGVNAVVDSIEPKFLKNEDAAARRWGLQVALAGRRDRDTTRLLINRDRELREVEFTPAFPEPASLLSHRIVGNVGYIRFHNSLGRQALVQEFDMALSELLGTQALVLDLRDTPSGGNTSVARGIMGRLVQSMLPYQRHELVSEFRRTGIRRVWDEHVAPRGAPFLKPVVVLVGRWTGSMGEGMAIGLNATRGAPVLGLPMARLLGANRETVLPHSKIVVRVPNEKLFHVDGTPREAFTPCLAAISHLGTAAQDQELRAAIDLASSAAAGAGAQAAGRGACGG